MPTRSICHLWQNYKWREFLDGSSSSLQEKGKFTVFCSRSTCSTRSTTAIKFVCRRCFLISCSERQENVRRRVTDTQTLIFFIKAPANEKLSSRENLWIFIFPIKTFTRLHPLTTLFTDAKAKSSLFSFLQKHLVSTANAVCVRKQGSNNSATMFPRLRAPFIFATYDF